MCKFLRIFLQVPAVLILILLCKGIFLPFLLHMSQKYRTFAAMKPRELHSDYYRDRWSESDLCHDFPGDEVLIDGLHAMQSHMWNNGVNIDIPIVQVMNTAHFLAAYMFATTCSGDQTEYDAMANMSLGRDKQLFRIAIIVLAAMLKRTDGFRARQCRNMLLENRDPDFEEGVTLYDRFLRSAEKHFSEEDFLIDTHAQIIQLQEENTRLTSENIKLKYTITTMEEKYQQFNIGTQNVNFGTINLYTTTATQTQTADAPREETQPQLDLFKFIHPSITDESERIKIHREIQNLVRTLPLPEICRYLMDMRKNNRVYLTVKPELMFDELHRMGMPDETTPGFSMKNFRSYFNVND